MRIADMDWRMVEDWVRYDDRCVLPIGSTEQHAGLSLATDAILAERVATLPAHLWRSLTWDQGWELMEHAQFSVDTDVAVYFCDPHSPWQRGTNENTNGLLRQYFPKGADLSGYSQEDLNAVALQLNTRPRKTLGFITPAAKLATTVASTA